MGISFHFVSVSLTFDRRLEKSSSGYFYNLNSPDANVGLSRNIIPAANGGTADGDLLEISQLIMYRRNAAISSYSLRRVLRPLPDAAGSP